MVVGGAGEGRDRDRDQDWEGGASHGCEVDGLRYAGTLAVCCGVVVGVVAL